MGMGLGIGNQVAASTRGVIFSQGVEFRHKPGLLLANDVTQLLLLYSEALETDEARAHGSRT